MNKIMYLVLFFAIVSCKNEIQKTEECTSFVGWRKKSDKIPELSPVFKVRLIGEDIFLLNEKLDKIEFSRRLNEYKILNPRPFYILSTKGAKCSQLKDVKQIMERSMQCNSGLCGIGENWKR